MSEIEKDTRGLGTSDFLKIMIFGIVILFIIIAVIADRDIIKSIGPYLLFLTIIAMGIFAGLSSIIRLLFDIKQALISQTKPN